ncbi:hypothetical protein C943_03841 [Mariniradius saccharolyticus AK6]|uniref:Uncharacterized protein n=1 Tax=Mariniradius saccharolyticus AK6 TaxID=1239962 RepID=M7X9D4_9BACT|nr:hypothetical protein C943_03841 [Mariniradius saccharolyticus AK6]
MKNEKIKHPSRHPSDRKEHHLERKNPPPTRLLLLVQPTMFP